MGKAPPPTPPPTQAKAKPPAPTPPAPTPEAPKPDEKKPDDEKKPAETKPEEKPEKKSEATEAAAEPAAKKAKTDEEIGKALKERKDGTSNYVQIDGVKYERSLLDTADKAVADGQISVKEATELYTSACDGPGITETEMRTLDIILKTYKFTDKARETLEGKLKPHKDKAPAKTDEAGDKKEALTKDELEKKTNDQLKEILKGKGLKLSGNKAELVERILAPADADTAKRGRSASRSKSAKRAKKEGDDKKAGDDKKLAKVDEADEDLE